MVAILNLSTSVHYSYAFITYDSVESAENAIKQVSAKYYFQDGTAHPLCPFTIIIKMNGGFVSKARIRVSFARKQPSLTDAPQEPNTEAVWNLGKSQTNSLLI